MGGRRAEGGRTEGYVLLFQRRTTMWQRIVDRALGVSRRRRQLAYAAIGGGLAVLRPLLRRGAVLALAATVVVLF